MQLEFYGATGCVTGSCHLLKVNNMKILLDCGLYQGKDEKNKGNETFNFNPKDIDYVILSHAHIDHSGRIPLLYKQGFNGKVICTDVTLDLCKIMLEDSGHIQETEAEWESRKRIRQGLPPVEPLYTTKIVELSLYLFKGYPYNNWIELFHGFKIRFLDAGHLLGSAIIEILVRENNKTTKLVYTGDLGNIDIPILKNPSIIENTDYLIMETTYGDRLHENLDVELKSLSKIIKDTFKKGGNVIIPSFAVGRTQEILYKLNNYIENNILENITVYVDSPLAYESTKIFRKYSNCYDEEAKNLLNSGDDPLHFRGLKFTKSPEESIKINKIQSGVIIISASGMCEAGRIKHHLKHNIWRKECSIVFTGYQADGTLGRKIVEGARKVKLFGEEIAVNSKIYNLQSLSGHADRKGLFDWLMKFKSKPKHILLVHGDNESRNSFYQLLLSKDYSCSMPNLGDTFIPGMEKNTRKSRILYLLDSLENIDTIDKNLLLEKIKDCL